MRPNDATTKRADDPRRPPAVGNAQAPFPPLLALTVDEWVACMIQTMNGLSSHPELLKRMRKRSF